MMHHKASGRLTWFGLESTLVECCICEKFDNGMRNVCELNVLFIGLYSWHGWMFCMGGWRFSDVCMGGPLLTQNVSVEIWIG